MDGTNEGLKAMRRSVRDKKLAGICGGFAEGTPLPSWLWRSIFLTLVFASGIGLVAYIVLWFFMPEGEPDGRAGGGQGPAPGEPGSGA